MPGEARGDVALDRLQGVVGVRAGERVKHIADAREQLAAALERRNGVLEARRRAGAGNGPSTSASCSAIARAKAGGKWPASMRENGGTPNAPLHSSKKGLGLPGGGVAVSVMSAFAGLIQRPIS